MKARPATVFSCAVFIFLLSVLAFGQEPNQRRSSRNHAPIFHNRSDLKPVFVMTMSDTWLMVYGTDMPDFVLYEDGTVIFSRCSEKDNPYSCYFCQANLSKDEAERLLEKLSLSNLLLLADAYAPDSTTVTASDLPARNVVMRESDGSYKRVSVYGWLGGSKPGHSAAGVPDVLKRTLDLIATFDEPRGSALNPEFVEVILEPFSGDATRTYKWPKDIPALDDPRTVKWSTGGRYSIFLPARYGLQIKKLVRKSTASDGALMIGKRQWRAQFRLPFPSESIWLPDIRK